MALPEDGTPLKSSQKDFKEEPFSQASQKAPAAAQMLPPSTPRNKADRPSTPVFDVQVAASQPDPHSSPPQPPHNQSPQEESKPADEEDAEPADDASLKLPDFDWKILEDKYLAAMDKANENEEELRGEFKMLANYFALWSNVSYVQDQDRAMKRYRTREAHIRHSEQQFEQKKQHYEKVIKAFQDAMDLLRNV